MFPVQLTLCKQHKLVPLPKKISRFSKNSKADVSENLEMVMCGAG